MGSSPSRVVLVRANGPLIEVDAKATSRSGATRKGAQPADSLHAAFGEWIRPCRFRAARTSLAATAAPATLTASGHIFTCRVFTGGGGKDSRSTSPSPNASLLSCDEDCSGAGQRRDLRSKRRVIREHSRAARRTHAAVANMSCVRVDARAALRCGCETASAAFARRARALHDGAEGLTRVERRDAIERRPL